MLKVQKQSLKGNVLTFDVILEDGSVQPCIYKLVDETEDELMARVALHIESEVSARDVVATVEAEPVKEVSVSKEGEASLKEVA